MLRRYEGIRTTEDEKLYIEALDLFPPQFLRESERGKLIRWYGGRLRFLMTFYGKYGPEVGRVAFTTAATVSNWCKNMSRPTKSQLKQLGFLFEIDPKFFFLPEVTMTIKDQTTIIYE